MPGCCWWLGYKLSGKPKNEKQALSGLKHHTEVVQMMRGGSMRGYRWLAIDISFSLAFAGTNFSEGSATLADCLLSFRQMTEGTFQNLHSRNMTHHKRARETNCVHLTSLNSKKNPPAWGVWNDFTWRLHAWKHLKLNQRPKCTQLAKGFFKIRNLELVKAISKDLCQFMSFISWPLHPQFKPTQPNDCTSKQSWSTCTLLGFSASFYFRSTSFKKENNKLLVTFLINILANRQVVMW